MYANSPARTVNDSAFKKRFPTRGENYAIEIVERISHRVVQNKEKW